MNTILEKATKETAIKQDAPDLRAEIANAESELKKIPGAMLGDCFPLVHTFGDGLYVREIQVPKDSLVVTKIHKLAHPYFVLKGEISVLTEKGEQRVSAPYYGITPAGTKRICYCHTDTVWVTVHATHETDLEKIENDIIAKDYDDILPDYVKNAIEI